ncbi:MAG: hypothetical protein VX663_11375 [Pseudomonadota bacterium]|nr:hypothetical protein [Pseudomonadota bacterium]
MHIFNNTDLASACSVGDCIEALYLGIRSYARGDALRRPRIDLFTPTSKEGHYGCFSSMEGVIRGGYYALRVKPDIISWPLVQGRRRRETYCIEPGCYGGLVLLFSAENGGLVAIMNDGWVQHARVGALAALGARYMADPTAETVGMIGSGGMARSYARSFANVRPIRRINAFSPNADNLANYCREMERDLGIEVAPLKRAQDAARGAQILAVCTNSADPVVFGEWIEPGTYLASATPWELDSSAWQRITKVGRLLNRTPLATENFQDDNFEIRQTVMSYLSGSPEERNAIPEKTEPFTARFDEHQYVPCIDWDDEQPCFEPAAEDVTLLAEVSTMIAAHRDGIRPGLASDGLQGLQFAAVAGRAYERARELGLGKELPNEWFVQDIPT